MDKRIYVAICIHADIYLWWESLVGTNFSEYLYSIMIDKVFASTNLDGFSLANHR